MAAVKIGGFTPHSVPGRAAPGRPQATSRHELERVAFSLFAGRGFEKTSVEDIASAAGIARRTFFRYFATKNDIVWGDYDRGLATMGAHLAAAAPTVPLMVAIRNAVVDFNTFDPAEEDWHRQRMMLILRVPSLYANSALRFAQWRWVIAGFAADRLGCAAVDLMPTLIGYSCLGASLTAYEQWLDRPSTHLRTLLETAFDILAAGFAGSGGPDGSTDG